MFKTQKVRRHDKFRKPYYLFTNLIIDFVQHPYLGQLDVTALSSNVNWTYHMIANVSNCKTWAINHHLLKFYQDNILISWKRQYL